MNPGTMCTRLSEVDQIGTGVFLGGDEIPAGTFHGGDEIPAGTFHSKDYILLKTND